jgi:hypothetical protein
VARRPPGRPALPADRRRSHTLRFRARGDTLSRLQAAADVSGRSLSEEIEYRVERSFDREDRAEITDALERLRAEQALHRGQIRALVDFMSSMAISSNADLLGQLRAALAKDPEYGKAYEALTPEQMRSLFGPLRNLETGEPDANAKEGEDKS